MLHYGSQILNLGGSQPQGEKAKQPVALQHGHFLSFLMRKKRKPHQSEGMSPLWTPVACTFYTRNEQFKASSKKMDEKRGFPQVSPAPVHLPSKGPRVPYKVLLGRRTRRQGILQAVVRGTTHGATAGGPGRHGDQWRWPGTAEQGPRDAWRPRCPRLLRTTMWKYSTRSRDTY